MKYPDSKKENTIDAYFETPVPDPYRWLESDTAADTKAWVIEQNKTTEAYLADLPSRKQIQTRLEQLWNYEKYSAPFKYGSYTYYYKNDGLQNQAVLYRQLKSGLAEVFLDPNKFSTDGTTSLAEIEFSKDGSLAAYQISESGSDWRKVIVIRTSDKSVVGQTLVDVKFSGLAWKGNDGFYYSSYDKPKAGTELSGMNQNHKLLYHKLNTDQSQDVLVFGGQNQPRRYIGASLTEDERFLVISAANSTTGNQLYFQDFAVPKSKIKPLITNFDNQHSLVGNIKDELLIITTLKAPNFRLIKVSSKKTGVSYWKNIIPHSDKVLSVGLGGGKIFATYLKDATSLVQQYSMDGRFEHQIVLPGLGSASGFGAKQTDKYLYYSFSSYLYPSTIFRYNIQTGKSTLFRKSGVKFDSQKYESKQVFYTSKDGTKIPMIITHKKGIVLDGKNMALLYGYGGFGINLTPAFSTSNIIWLEQGGIYAVANLRGGGEYGDKWHSGGIKLQKQNVFDDFIGAAQYLIDTKYSNPSLLAIAGGSNGGLLVGAVMTQRPNLFAVALPAVGVLDMLRYDKFTAGAGWAYDYGTAQDSKQMFEYLYNYSPYHALKSGVSYPATMVFTGDHDDRVVPAHSFKFAARLQEYHKGTAPVLIRIETKAGHGAGKSTAQIISEQADKWAFVFANLQVEYTK